MSQSESQSRRKNPRSFQLVDRGFQFRMVWRATLPFLFSLGFAAIVVLWFSDHDEPVSPRSLRWMALLGLALIGLAAFAGGVWSMLLYSSRVAGPLRSLDRALARLEAGDLTARFQVRQKDELRQHAERMNRSLLSMQERVRRVRQFCRYARGVLEEMSAKGGKDERLEKMLDLVSAIEASVGDFKLE
ncbi:MAG: hypothetical protein K1X75_14360 [Leptospirales bacterium]|nr:hypothetical protein [Leptospirales bacterium]